MTNENQGCYTIADQMRGSIYLIQFFQLINQTPLKNPYCKNALSQVQKS